MSVTEYRSLWYRAVEIQRELKHKDKELEKMAQRIKELKREKMCPHERTLNIQGKTNDLCSVSGTINNREYSSDGYVPDGIGVVGWCADYIEFEFCADCGQILGDNFPISDDAYRSAIGYTDNPKQENPPPEKTPTTSVLTELLDNLPEKETVLRRHPLGLLHEETGFIFDDNYTVIGKLQRNDCQQLDSLVYADHMRCEEEGWRYST